MNIVSAIVLGLVQGLTEFIPVSSSGHMIIATKVFGLSSDFKFDVLLNIGTLIALVVYYRETIADILRDVFVKKKTDTAIKILAATIPTVFVGYRYGDKIEQNLQSVVVVSISLFVIGLAMILYRQKNNDNTVSKLSIGQAIKIGIAQTIALIPGSSRSGITILAGQSVGLKASEAARFSFMLAIPTISGATAKVALSSEGRAFAAEHLGLIVLGNVVSFISGLVAIHFLINMLGRRGLKPFGWYRIVLSSLLIALLFAKIL